MRLFLFLAFLLAIGSAQRISNETYQDNSIELIFELQLRDFTVTTTNGDETNDQFIDAKWDPTRQNVFFWTNGPFFEPLMYRINYRDLLTAVDPTTVPFESFGFTQGNDVSVDSGVYSASADALMMSGGRYLFLMSKASTTLTNVSSSFTFPNTILAFSSFIVNDDTGYFVQYSNISGGNPGAIAIPFKDYSKGYPLGQKSVVDLGTEEITESFLHEDSQILFLGSRLGVVEVRDASQASLPLLTTFTVTDSEIGNFAYDPTYGRLYICLNAGDGVNFMRLNVTGGVNGDAYTWNYWNGTVISSNTTTTPGVAVTTILTVGQCQDIMIDPPIGTGYVAMTDSTGIGFLAKMNLHTLEDVISYIPIERENSGIIALYFEKDVDAQNLLYGVTTYTVAVWNYTSACSLDCENSEGHGSCVDGVCDCAEEWWGLSCSTASCHPPCGDYDDPFRGECIQGQCICQPRWTDAAAGCTTERCPNDCSGNGDCDIEANYTCICEDVRGGEDCSQLKFQYCDQVNHYNLTGSLETACLDLTPYLGCGYCSHYIDNATGYTGEICLDGNRAGPVVDACMWYFYDGSWNPAFLVFIVVMMVAWGIMFILNAYSMLAEDWRFAKMRTENKSPHYYGTKGYQKKLWWRDERSHKSWKMFDQMQFLSAYGVINALFTTRLYNFLAFWNWSLFIIPLGGTFQYHGDHPMRAFNWTPVDFPFPTIPASVWTTGVVNTTVSNKRLETDYTYADTNLHRYRTPLWTVTRPWEENFSEKRDYEQYVNSTETMADLIFPTAVIWFLITLFGFLIMYTVYYLVMLYIVHRDDDNEEFKRILGFRYKHIVARTLHAFYFPAIFLGVFSIQVEQKPVIILAIVFGLIIVGLGLPGFFLLLTQQPLLTEWFDPALRIPYGSFYAPFQKKRIKFQFFVYMRKFATGAALAAMARGYNPDDSGLFWAQIIVTLAFMVFYMILLLWKRPYIDMIHLIVDAALCLLNLVTVLLSLLAIQTDSGTQDAVQWIVLVIQIPCMFLVIVAYCWSSMFYAGYTSPKQFFCCEGKPVQEGDDKLIEINGAGEQTEKPEDKGPADFSSDEALNNMDLSSSTSVD